LHEGRPSRGVSSRVHDTIAGLSVAAVVIPQSLAYAQLAGMPASRGLYAAAVPPVAAAPLASSPYLQPGPTAMSALLTFGALSPLAATGSSHYVELGLLLALVVGVVRLAIGLARAGFIAHLVSDPTLMGFVPAAAILIVASQLPTAVGAPESAGGVLRRGVVALVHPGSWHPATAALAVATAGLLVVSPRVHKLFPAVLVAVGVGLLVGEFTDFGGATIGDVGAGWPPFSLRFPWSDLPQLLLPGTVIALVGFTEAASIARTYAAIDRHRWDPDREFVGQGVANVAAAVSGGFPVGASFSRSALNRLAGARSSFSSVVTGAVVLAFLPASSVLSPLPQGVLAAIVIVAVVPLIRLAPLLRLWRISKPQFFVGAATFAATLALSPHVERGVAIGIGLAVAVHLWRELALEVDAWTTGATLHLRPTGVLWFATAETLEERFLAALAGHGEISTVNLHLDGLGRIDTPGALRLRTLLGLARDAGLAVEIVNVRSRWRPLVGRVIERHEDPLLRA
jgi:SulP family sulfate permease